MKHARVLLLGVLWIAARCAHAAPVTALAFSPDGSMLAAASGSNVSLHSTSPWMKEQTTFPCAKDRAVAVAFQPAGALLAIGSGVPGESGAVQLIDWRQKRRLALTSNNTDVITQVAFSPDGKHLATASADKTAAVYRIEESGQTLAPAFALSGHSAAVRSIAFGPDGTTIVTASVDRSLKVWSTIDGSLLRSLGQHTDAVQCLAFRPASPDRAEVPAYCASGGDERAVRVWQPTIGRMVRIVRRHNGPVLALAFTPDGRSLFCAGQEGLIRRIYADSDEVLGEWRASNEWIYSLAISPDGRTLATGDWAGQINRWWIGEGGIESATSP